MGVLSLKQTKFRRIKYSIKDLLDNYPIIYNFLYEKFISSNYVTSSTNLLVEGFPSSGNTFMYENTKEVLPPNTIISSHLHSVSQLVKSLKFGIPVLFCLRNPIDCSVSNYVRQRISYGRTIIDYEKWLLYWINYHRRILNLIDIREIKVCMFEKIISDPIELIIYSLNLNIKYSYEKKMSIKNKLRNIIFEKESLIKGERFKNTSFPNKEKEYLKKQIINELLSKRSDLAAEANEIHEKILKHSCI